MTRLKICGLMRPEDIRLCESLPIDLFGFVCEYPIAVPWNLSMPQAEKLLNVLSDRSRSCLVSGGSPEKLLLMAQRLRPRYLQLHYHETLAETAFLVKQLRSSGIGIIKTLPTTAEERLFQFGTASTQACVEQLVAIHVDMILVDTRSPDNATQRNMQPDLATFMTAREQTQVPVMLAGGITADNVAALLTQAHPQWIDVMSGVEESPGQKDAQQLQRLVHMVKP